MKYYAVRNGLSDFKCRNTNGFFAIQFYGQNDNIIIYLVSESKSHLIQGFFISYITKLVRITQIDEIIRKVGTGVLKI